MLKAGRAIVNHETPILGINQGTIGFMADILPNNNMEKQLGQILNGEHKEDNRCLLSAKVLRNGKIISANLALNDIVLYNGNVARLINFKVFVDDQFVMHLRSDGLITATPTGSTAYALSAGGPILYPTLHNIVIVPMFPHTLTSRPIVLSENSTIRLVIPNNKTITPNLGCDGQTHLHLLPGDEVIIKKHAHKLRIIHPKDFNYFNLLREKLGFNTYIGSNRGHR